MSAVTPRGQRRPLALVLAGDNDYASVRDAFEAKVEALLKDATQGRVHIEHVSHLSFETEVVLSADSVLENNFAAIRRLAGRHLGADCRVERDTRRLPVPGAPATTTADQLTVVLTRNSQPRNRSSLCIYVSRRALFATAMLAAAVHLVWLVVVVRG